MHVRTRRMALSEGVIAGVFFGTASILIRFLQALDAFSIAFWRLVVASLTLTLILIILRRSFYFTLVRKNLKELVVISMFLGLHFIFFISAVKDTSILDATVFVNTTPIFSMLISTFLFKSKPSRFAVLGLAISLIGICVISYAEVTKPNTSADPEVLTSTIKGDFEAIAAAIFLAFYLNFGKRTRKQMDLLSIMVPVYALTALVVALLGIPFTNKALTLPTDASVILPLLGLGIIPTATAHTLLFSSLSNLKSFETATMALLEPIGATILGIVLFQELPASVFIIGAAFVLMGILLVVKNGD